MGLLEPADADGPVREYYLQDPLQVAGEQDLVTEVGWPVFRADR